MAIFNFFKTAKHQKYKYIPRYYDPNKEELMQRYKHAKLKASDSPEAVKARISDGLRRKQRGNGAYRKQQVLRSNLILLAVIAFLVFSTFFFLIKYLPVIVKMVE